jgi:hypothetical protein
MKQAAFKLLALLAVCALDPIRASNEYDSKAPLNGNRAFQDYAPEYLEIQPVTVQVIAENDLFHQGRSIIKIQADILQVYRSGAGLKPGQKIQINYERKNSIGFGDVQPGIPAEGVATAAFLRSEKRKNCFVPAAQQYTFAPLTPEQMERINPRKKAAGATPPASDIRLRIEDSNKAPGTLPVK